MLETTLGRRFERAIGGPSGFRRFLERRGPIFVKIGQFLALRPDLIPPEYCQELLRLFELVPAFPWSDARQIIREDLNGEPGQLFRYFDPKPVAAGSLAQTYFARLHNGAEVAVKVLRPGIEARVASDLRHARRLAKVLELSGSTLIASPTEVVEEIGNWLTQELDLQHELSNLRRFRGLTKRDHVQVVPRPYLRLSSRRVLTAEYIRGSHVIGLLSGSPAQPPPGLTTEAPIDKDQFAERLIQSCLTQIFRYRFFHADVHPGNLVALPGGRIAFVDFGLCETLDETVRKRQTKYLSALYSGNSDQLLRHLEEILIPGPDADADGLRRDFFATVRSWSLETADGVAAAPADGPYSSPVAKYMISIMRAARQNGYTMPVQLLAMYRTLLTAESVASQLSRRADLRRVGRTFIEKLQFEETLKILEGKQLLKLLTSHLSLWSEYPNQVNQILGDVADNRFVLKVSMSENADLRQTRNRRARAVIASIIAVSVAALIPLTASSGSGLGPLRWFLLGVLLFLYVVVYLDYRRLK